MLPLLLDICNTNRTLRVICVQLAASVADVLPSGVVRGRKNPLHFGFPRRLKRARKELGLSRFGATNKAAAKDRELVASLEAGDRIPRLDTVERIAYALSVSPAFLAFGIQTNAEPMAKGLRCDGVGQRLADARTARGLSVLAVAKLAGLSHTAVGNVERGTMPTLATAEALAKALDLSPAWLAFGVGPRELPPRRRARPAPAQPPPTASL